MLPRCDGELKLYICYYLLKLLTKMKGLYFWNTV